MTLHLLVGPERHGVVAHGARIGAAGSARVVRAPSADAVPDLSGERVIAQVTDRLYGADAAAAAEALLATTAGAAHLVVVLHDLPQESDGRHHAARAAAYARMARAADDVVVASEHEAALLREIAPEVAPSVLPLPIDRWADGASPAQFAEPPVVVTLGFIYPGKGLEDVVDACAPLDRPIEVRNLGACSDGHEHLAEDLANRAAEQGIPWSTTGWLSAAQLREQLHEATVPVAAHRHLSASGSINAWIEAGRRPLVTRSRYAVELAARLPGAVTLVDDHPAALTQALRAACAAPATTWLGRLAVGPSSAECAMVLETLARR